MSEEATLVVQLPKVLEKQLRAHYDEMVSTAIERALEDKGFCCKVLNKE